MKLLDEIFNREHVALPSPAETAESREAYEAQTLAEIGNPAERVMRQGERGCPPPPPNASAEWILDNEGRCTYTAQNQGGAPVIMSVEEAWEYHDIAMQAIEDSHAQTIFLTPARNLNSVFLTNMSDEALASLVFAQTYAEENWFKDYAYPHPYYNRGDDPAHAPADDWFSTNRDNINDKRKASAWHGITAFRGFGWLSVLGNRVVTSKENNDSLSGVGFGLANQSLWQAWEAMDWYWEYSQRNLDVTHPLDLHTNVHRNARRGPFAEVSRIIPQHHRTVVSELITEISDGGLSPLHQSFGGGVDSAELNVLRFVYAGARQREGLDYTGGMRNYRELVNSSAEFPEGVPGRPYQDVSALSLVAHVFSGAVTVDEFMDSNQRNKAILTVERLREGHPDNFRIVTHSGLGVENLVTAYDVADSPEALDQLSVGQGGYDFLPYNQEEATSLVEALVQEAATGGEVSQAYKMLFQTEGSGHLYSQLLLDAYIFYRGEDALDNLLKTVQPS